MTEYRDCDIPNDDEELAPEQIRVSPAALAFEDTYVWRDSQYQTATITNSGSVDWFFADISVTGEFDITTVSIPNGLKAGKSITIKVIFSPTKVGTASGKIELRTLRGATATITLAGKGLERPKENDDNDSGSGGDGGSSGGGSTVITAALNNWEESLSGANSILEPKGGAATLNAIIKPKGSGAVAGNERGTNRGQYSFDMQLNNTKATTVAGGNYSAIVSGRNNTALGAVSFIGSGYNNTVRDEKSGILTGEDNEITGTRSVIAVGERNEIEGSDNGILTGSGTVISGTGNIIGYGYTNRINGNYSSILSGLNNTFEGNRNIILTGEQNDITGSYNLFGYVSNLTTTMNQSVIQYCAGSSFNSTNKINAIRLLNCNINASENLFVGSANKLYANNATNGIMIVGDNNTLGGTNPTIISGSDNTVNSTNSTVLSGSNNSINSGSDCTILLGSNNYISSCNTSLIAASKVNITNLSNAVILSSSNLTISETTTRQYITAIGTRNGSIEEASSISNINSSGVDIINSSNTNILGGTNHFISSSNSVLCLQGNGNTSDQSKESVFLGGYKNKSSGSEQSIALGGSRNVHMAEDTLSLGGQWGHDLMVSNHVFRALKEGVEYRASKLDDSTGEATTDNPGNNLADWVNGNHIYQTGKVLLQSMAETSRGMYDGTQEYKKYFLTHSLKYLSNNVWADLQRANNNNTLIVPENVFIFWKLKFQLCDFTGSRAISGICADGIIMSTSEGISVIKTHKLTLTKASGSSDTNNSADAIPDGDITIEINTKTSQVYFCIPLEWKDFIGGAELSYQLVSNTNRDFYWE